jgi:hypothetical protein
MELDMEAQKIDGLWTAEFGSSLGSFGGGVAIFQNGKISGGDGTYFYVGNYKIQGKELSRVPGACSIRQVNNSR